MPTLCQQDYYRKHGKYKKVYLWDVILDPGLVSLYFLRKAQASRPGSLRGKIYRVLLKGCQVRYGYQISARTEIGGGLYLGHWGTVVVNPGAKIGKNCNIAHGVTIGQTNRGKRAGVPTIGDDVWIGTNAVIVGSISIGNNVLIAPNSYVTRDVPDNSLVVGNPAKVMSAEEATEGYINNRV